MPFITSYQLKRCYIYFVKPFLNLQVLVHCQKRGNLLSLEESHVATHVTKQK